MNRLLLGLAGLLVLPLAILLFAQWPLREIVQAGSRTANDLAQIFFAVYMAFAVSAASRSGSHLVAGQGAGANQGSRPVWKTWLLAACTVPWALFLVWSSAPFIWRSVVQLERFSDTLTPGYFIIKVAVGLLGVLALGDAWDRWAQSRHRAGS